MIILAAVESWCNGGHPGTITVILKPKMGQKKSSWSSGGHPEAIKVIL